VQLQISKLVQKDTLCKFNTSTWHK